MIAFSTGLKLSMVGFGGFAHTMQSGCLRVYSGERPPSPDAPIPGGGLAQLLGLVTTDGAGFVPGEEASPGGLTFRINSLGDIGHNGLWVFSCSRGGKPSWFRWVWALQDNDRHSLYYPRIDGDVGPGKDFDFPYTDVFYGQNVVVNHFLMKMG